ncbi:peptidase C13 [Dyella sp. 2RAB6]|uniref:peptidase C13 n=1 Tax=Dyella sp. 2RAB6 TaxID=3232992 RepID=UPI003F904333
MTSLLFLALLSTPGLPADDFSTRVQQAKLTEAAKGGSEYQKAMWAAIGDRTTDALKACITSLPKPNKTPFTLVAEVHPDGSLGRVEVRAPTDVATCLLSSFANWKLPAPPASPAPYPIEVDFTIEP